MENFIERLTLQSEAFQESFNVLSRVRNLEELAKKFFQILRGNLLVLNAVILYKKSENSAWNILFSKSGSDEDIRILSVSESVFSISEVDHPEFKLAVTHQQIDKAFIRIILGSKLDNSTYSQFDKMVLQFYLQQLDSAYQFFIARKKEKQLIFNLNHRVLQLNSLIDTGIEVARLQEGSQLLHLALERVLALTNASRGMLLVKQGRKIIDKIFFPFSFKNNDISISKHLISADFCFAEKKYIFYLLEKESREGLIAFDATDQLLLDAFARQVHVSLENHYLYEQSLEKERIDKEISLAGDIQKKLIPIELPKIEGYDQCGVNIPTKFVGGDYYDCIPLKDGRFMFIMADVSGKGVAAGLLVSTLHASVHAYIDGSFELPALVQKLNKIIWNSSTLDKYITAFFALLDPASGELESVNAGHNPIYLLRNNKKLEELKTGGIPLGMMNIPFPYESAKSTINQGDHVLLYTDGVTEAMNEQEEEYDDVVSLKKFLMSQSSSTAKDFISNLIDDVNNFTGDTPQSDDITALYLTRISQ